VQSFQNPTRRYAKEAMHRQSSCTWLHTLYENTYRVQHVHHYHNSIDIILLSRCHRIPVSLSNGTLKQTYQWNMVRLIDPWTLIVSPLQLGIYHSNVCGFRTVGIDIIAALKLASMSWFFIRILQYQCDSPNAWTLLNTDTPYYSFEICSCLVDYSLLSMKHY